MADVRAMLVLTNLDALGTVLTTTPSRQAIDEGAFERDLEVEIASDAGEEALRIAASGTEIAAVTVSPVHRGTDDSLGAAPSSCSPGVREEEDRRTRERDREKGREIKNIRVDIHQLDHIMNLVEDLVINRGRLKQIAELHRIKEMDEAISVVGSSPHTSSWAWASNRASCQLWTATTPSTQADDMQPSATFICTA